jgi:hypothetical protein
MNPIFKRVRLLIYPGAGLALMGAHPAPKGSELEVVAGQTVTEYRTSEGTPTYRYVSNGLAVHVGGRVRFDNNLTFAAQADVDHGIVSGLEQVSLAQPGQASVKSSDIGDVQWTGGTAMRVGWHDGIIGGEVGMAIVNLPEVQQHLFPSATAWLGVPKFVYAWGSTYAGPISRAQSLNEPMVGLGHKGDHVTFWWGTHVLGRLQNLPWQYAPVANPFPDNAINPSSIPYVVGTTFQVSDGVRLGLEYGAGDHSSEQTVSDNRFSLVVHVDGEHYGKL